MLSATDSDLNQAGEVMFSIAAPPHQLQSSVSDGRGIFTIDPISGTISTEQYLGSLPYSQYLLHIEVTDQAVHQPMSSVHLLYIELTEDPLPSPIFTEPDYTKTIAENLPTGEPVLNVSCIEENSINDFLNLTVSITEGNVNTTFGIAGSAVVVTNPPDYEAVNKFILTLECRNHPFNQSTTVEAVLVVTNLNDNHFNFSEPQYYAELYENATNGDIILHILASDADLPNATVEYFFNSSSDYQSIFTINSTTGAIIVDAASEQPFDREERDNYTLSIMAVLYTQNGGVADRTESTVTIQLLDINDYVPMFLSSVYELSNLTQVNTAGDVVVVVSAIDKDLNAGGQVQYAIGENQFFSIYPDSGIVYVNSTMLDRGTFLVNVTATDMGSPALTGTALLDIFVRPVPEDVRFTKPVYQFTYPENIAQGSTIGTVQAIVYDVVNDTIDEGTAPESLEYTIDSGSNISPFHLDIETGELILVTSLDFETEAKYTLTIAASLSSHPQIEAAMANVLFTLTDVNDNRPRFERSSYAAVIFEDAAKGTVVLNVSANDKDQGASSGEIRYQIEENFNGPFNVSSTTGEIFTSATLDSPQDYHFLVMATDGGGEEGVSFTSSTNVFISVARRAAVKPLFSRSQYVFSIPESFDSSSNAVIGRIGGLKEGNRSVDAIEDGVRFRIKLPGYASSAADVPFTINATSGAITANSFDFNAETRSDFVFYVELVDASNSSLVHETAPVVIKIIDENDNPPLFSQTEYSVTTPISTPAGSSLLTVAASDPDFGSNGAVRYSLQSVVLGFHVNAQTGAVSVANSSLLPGDYHLSIVATDSGVPPMNSSVPLHITVLRAQNATNITFSQPFYTFNVAENSPPTTPVGTVSVTAVEGFSLSPADISYSFTYNIACLTINNAGAITISCNDLDREKQALYSVSVAAVHTPSGATARVKVNVAIQDVNDNSPIFNRLVYSELITDDYSSNTPILTVSATDADNGTNGTVAYSYGSHYPLFTINPETGDIFLSSSDPPTGDYNLTVIAYDEGVSTANGTASVLISIVSKTPEVLLFSKDQYLFSVVENSPGNTQIGILELLAPSPINPSNYLGNLDFQILSGDNISFFYVRDSDGALLLVNDLLDREEADTHVLVIQASFQDYSVMATTYVTVSVTDDNDNSPVFNQTIYPDIISDTVMLNSEVILTVKATDDDFGTNAQITYSLESGSPFAINSTNGAITATSIPSTGHYALTVTAVDGGSVSQTGTAQISIIVEISAPAYINFTQINYTGQMDENSPPGTSVVTVDIQQSTSGLNGLVFTISSNPYFTVGPTSGTVSNLVQIDREAFTGGVYTVTASVPSIPSLSASAEVAILINDVNDNRPVFTKTFYTPSFTYALKGPNNNIQTLVVNDADMGDNGEVNTINIVGSGGARFNMNYATKTFISPDPLVPPGYYHFTLEAVDEGTPPLTGTATVLVTVFVAVPTGIAFQTPNTFSRVESTPPGTVLGSIALQQPLSTANIDSIRYNSSLPLQFVTLSSGNLDTSVEVINVSPFDYESGVHQYNFTVTAILALSAPSTETLAISTTVTLNILDVNDNAPVFTGLPSNNKYTAQVTEGQSANVLVFTVDATDADSGSNGEVVFRLADNMGGRFKVGQTSGQIRTGSTLIDRETDSSFLLTVIATDQGTEHHSASAAVQVNVGDVNDNAPSLTSGNTYTISEELPVGSVAFTVHAVDPDLGVNGFVKYSLAEGSPPMFTIPSASVGAVRIAQRIDYDGSNPHSYSFTLEMRDSGFPSQLRQALITVNILNVPNDSPPQFNHHSTLVMISPSLSQGEEVLRVTAYDADSHDTITYSIASIAPSQLNQNLFTIDSSTGAITKGTTDALDPGDVIMITVQAQDSSQYHLTNTTLVSFQVLQQFSFSEVMYVINIRENAVTGTVAYTLRLVNPSFVADATFRILPQDVPFSLNKKSNEVDLLLSGSLDHETKTSYFFSVTARSQHGEGSASVTVQVTDVNDNTPMFTDPEIRRAFTVNRQNYIVGSVIGRVNATDADSAQNGAITFTIREENLPISIDSTTGMVHIARSLEDHGREISLNVVARDGGSPPRSATAMYKVHVIGVGGGRGFEGGGGNGGAAVGGGLGGVLAIMTVVTVILVILLLAKRRKKDSRKQ